jgi:retron-type reverse transcriptase
MKGVSWKESVQRYEANAMSNIVETRHRLISGESIQSGFVEFMLSERGKIRHIKSIHISERVVQKCLCDEVLVPILSHSLIYDNSASLKGKGVHWAIRRFILHMTKFYRQHGSNKGYALIIDFSKFFDRIDHDNLYKMIEKQISDEKIINLTKIFISVFGDGVSLGLGSQVSQICAIFYPNILDHFIKEKLRVKYYGRYMDDLYLIHESKDYLKHCLLEIIRICEELKIAVNTKKTKIVKLADPVVFLKGKYSMLPNGKILRRPSKDSTVRMRRKLVKFRVLIEEGKMKYGDLRISYQSWRGNFRWRFIAFNKLRHLDRLYYNLFINNHV